MGKCEAAARDAVLIAESSGYQLQNDFLSIWSNETNKELLFYWSYVENDKVYGTKLHCLALVP